MPGQSKKKALNLIIPRMCVLAKLTQLLKRFVFLFHREKSVMTKIGSQSYDRDLQRQRCKFLQHHG
jgi:hypothetical protein